MPKVCYNIFMRIIILLLAFVFAGCTTPTANYYSLKLEPLQIADPNSNTSNGIKLNDEQRLALEKKAKTFKRLIRLLDEFDVPVVGAIIAPPGYNAVSDQAGSEVDGLGDDFAELKARCAADGFASDESGFFHVCIHAILFFNIF